MTKKLITDRGKALEAISDDPFALEYFNDELKADPEIVLAAVSQSGHALVFASEELQKDPELIALANKD